jgi:hypothetical protein
VLACPRCRARLGLVATIEDPRVHPRHPPPPRVPRSRSPDPPSHPHATGPTAGEVAKLRGSAPLRPAQTHGQRRPNFGLDRPVIRPVPGGMMSVGRPLSGGHGDRPRKARDHEAPRRRPDTPPSRPEDPAGCDCREGESYASWGIRVNAMIWGQGDGSGLSSSAPASIGHDLALLLSSPLH